MARSSFSRRAIFLVPVMLGLSACEAGSENGVTVDPHLTELDARAHRIIDPITSANQLSVDDVSGVICAGVDETWLPSKAGNFGDIEVLSVPGQLVPPAINAADFPPQPPDILTTYQLSLAGKTLGRFTPVAIMMSYDPATKSCSAGLWWSGP